MNRGTLLKRLTKGVRWAWTSEAHRDKLPPDLVDTVMTIESDDRRHAKQGRSTARVRFDAPDGGRLSVYLKRHEKTSLVSKIAAMLVPSGIDTPATVEWSHLRRAEALGVRVPKTVAAGEWIGPWGALRGFLMVEELVGAEELNVAIPRLSRELPPEKFRRLKRELIREAAGIAARLHASGHFQKDLYLCHYFLSADPDAPEGGRLTLIDLHRMREQKFMSWRWRWKDLGQLLFSTHGVEGIDDRDRLRFWLRYRRLAKPPAPRLDFLAVRFKARRYLAHNA